MTTINIAERYERESTHFLTHWRGPSLHDQHDLQVLAEAEPKGPGASCGQ